jgi:hypothetical protein
MGINRPYFILDNWCGPAPAGLATASQDATVGAEPTSRKEIMNCLTTELTFRHAATQETDPRIAVEELRTRIGIHTADAVFLFVSSDYDLQGLAEALRENVSVPLLCCTTAGEISSELGYTQSGIAAAAIKGCRAELLAMKNVSSRDDSIDRMLYRMRHNDVVDSDPEQSSVGLLVVDGLCHREESLIERLQSAMPAVPLVGGSAGDSCQFKQTLVFIDGEFRSDSAALLLLSGAFTAIPFQTHHFVSSGVRVVVTEADAPARKVMRLDDICARDRLAQVLGCPPESITPDWLASRPLMLKVGDSLFVRSVHTIHPDGSLSLYCALHEGEILHVGKAGEIVDTTGSYFEAMRHQKSTPDLVLGFDCILRRLELNFRGRTSEMNSVLRNVPFVGFSTFGEQIDGQHVNQTMTGVALWKR